jgi:hypothetical protein
MKDSGTLFGGSLSSAYINTRKIPLIFCHSFCPHASIVPSSVAQYLFKCVQAWDAKGFTAYAIGIQVNG